MLDVDQFKKYNDKFGHPAGDECLTGLGRVLREISRRPGDLAARLGGDEFALILGDMDATESRNVAEALMQGVADLGIVFDESRRLTVSAGVASMKPLDQQDEELLFKEADRALYHAKSAGRNRFEYALPVGET